MDKSKTIRDIVIIIIIIAAAIYIISNRPSGPAGSADEPAHMANSPVNQEGVDMMHQQRAPDIKSGEPLITLGDNWVGQGWIDFTAGTLVRGESSHDMGGPLSEEDALTEALFSGVNELIYDLALVELNISADPDEMAAQEEQFYSGFESEQEADEFMAANGVSLDRMRAMWERELIGDGVDLAIGEKFSVEPGSSEATASFRDWMMELMEVSDLVFVDPDHEAAFLAYFEEMAADPHDHGAMEDDPHGIGETEDDVHTSSAGSDCESLPVMADECDHTSGDEACC